MVQMNATTDEIGKSRSSRPELARYVKDAANEGREETSAPTCSGEPSGGPGLWSSGRPHRDESRLGPLEPEALWVSPIGDDRILPDTADPAEITVARESIRLAFVTALQHLPARQRAALILCDVLRWQASEAAELLDTSVAAVNSALQRARATMAALPAEARPLDVPSDNAELLARYVAAFESYDIDSFVSLLHEDAIQSMPPYAMWLQGAENIGRWMVLPGPSACRGSRLVATSANGCPAFAQYRPDPSGGYYPWALQVLEITAGRVRGINSFLDAKRLFLAFGLPSQPPA